MGCAEKAVFAEHSAPGFLEQAVPETALLDPANRQIAPTALLERPAKELAVGITPAQSAEILAQLARQLVSAVPWGHHVELLKKVKDPAARFFYLRATARLGWSRSVLLNQIKAGAYERAVKEKRFYLNLLNDKERGPDDQPSIGIILCAQKDDVEVEFALKSKTNPIGVAEYHLQPRLPAEFIGRLPTAKQLADAVRKAKGNR